MKEFPGLEMAVLITWLIVVGVGVGPVLAEMPAPEDQEVIPFTALARPELSGEGLGVLRPIGVGPLAEGGETLLLSVGLARFSQSVDVYVGVYSATLNPSEVFLILMNGALAPLSEGGLVPFAQGLDEELWWETPWGEIPLAALPAGRYDLYLLVTPTHRTDSFYLWTTSFSVRSGSGTEGPGWVRTGGPLGGLGYDVRMRPDNPDILYVTDAWAGVHMSTDGGETWFPSNQGIPATKGPSGDGIPVFCLTIDPHDHDIIWVGTQDVRGIFKSSDGGLTWARKDNGVKESNGITFRGFTVDPRSSLIVYAAAELSSGVWAGKPRNGKEFDMTAGVIYKTSNGGESWTEVWRGNNLARYVWIHPGNPDVVYASTGIFDREAADSNWSTGTPGGEGVIKSIDGGKTWRNVNSGLGNLYVGSLFMHPADPDILLAGTGNNVYFKGGGVYLTTDGAANWVRVLGGEYMNINAVEFARFDPSVAYAGSAETVYRSSDGGWTWEAVAGGLDGWGAPGIRAGFPIDFEVDPRAPGRIFANNYGGGNFLSEDGGGTWKDASTGYTGAQVRGIAAVPGQPASVYAASRSGMFLSRDGGDSWQGLAFPPAVSLEWQVVAVDPGNAQHVLASNNWNREILESTDGGTTWRQVALPPDPSTGWWALAFAPSDALTAYAGTSSFTSAGTFDPVRAAHGVSVSRDGGTTWTSANDSSSLDANIRDIAVDPANSSTVYIATGNRGLLKTLDGGMMWTAQDGGLPDGVPVFSVAVHPGGQVVYAGLEGAGLYRSPDAGGTWGRVESGLAPEASITAILFDPGDSSRVYVADSMSGVYRSNDGGLTWEGMSEGLDTRAVNRLAITSDGQHLYAATEGGGVFRLDLGGIPPSKAGDN